MRFLIVFRVIAVCLCVQPADFLLDEIILQNIDLIYVSKQTQRKFDDSYNAHLCIVCDLLFHADIHMNISGIILTNYDNPIDFKYESQYALGLMRTLCIANINFQYDLDIFWLYYIFMDKLNKFVTGVIQNDKNYFIKYYMIMTEHFNSTIKTLKCERYAIVTDDLNVKSFTEHKQLINDVKNNDYKSLLYLAEESKASLRSVGKQITDKLGAEIIRDIPNFENYLLFNNILINNQDLLINMSKFFDSKNKFKEFIESDLMQSYENGKNDYIPVYNKICSIIKFQEKFIVFSSIIILQIFERHLFYTMDSQMNGPLKLSYNQKMMQILYDFIDLFYSYRNKPYVKELIIITCLFDKIISKHVTNNDITKFDELKKKFQHSVTKYVKISDNTSSNDNYVEKIDFRKMNDFISHAQYIIDKEKIEIETMQNDMNNRESVFSGVVFMKYLRKILQGIDFTLVQGITNIEESLDNLQQLNN